MNRPARVLHVIDSLDLGGAQTVLLNLVRHADRTRFTPEVACMHGRGVFWEQFARLGVPLHSLSPRRDVPLYLLKLAALLARNRYQIVHCHLFGANLVAKPLAALFGVPVRINHDHCNDKLADPRRWAPRADALTNRLSSHIVAVSESTRGYLLTHGEVEAARCTTIHNGVDVEVFQPRPERRRNARQRWNLPEGAMVVGGLGRLTYQKNFGLFLSVAARIRQRFPEACFVLAGTGEEEAALRAQARELGLDGAVHFLGYVGDMVSLYPALDALLLTSRYEGLPVTILEAMAAGVPVVSSRLDGVAEILTDGEDAALVTPGDEEQFAARLGELLACPALAERYSAAALAKVRAGYSAQVMTQKIEAIYGQALQSTAACG